MPLKFALLMHEAKNLQLCVVSGQSPNLAICVLTYCMFSSVGCMKHRAHCIIAVHHDKAQISLFVVWFLMVVCAPDQASMAA